LRVYIIIRSEGEDTGIEVAGHHMRSLANLLLILAAEVKISHGRKRLHHHAALENDIG